MSLFQICWVHYLLGGNTTDIDFADDNSLLGVSDGGVKIWLKVKGGIHYCIF